MGGVEAEDGRCSPALSRTFFRVRRETHSGGERSFCLPLMQAGFTGCGTDRFTPVFSNSSLPFLLRALRGGASLWPQFSAKPVLLLQTIRHC